MTPVLDLDAAVAPAKPAEAPAAAVPHLRRVAAAGLGGGLLLALTLALAVPTLREAALLLVPAPPPVASASDAALRRAEARVAQLGARLEAMVPRSPYLVVSTTENRIFLKRGGLLLHEGVCSTGSYVRLKGEGGQEWMFETPRGGFRIQKKTKKPVWSKPDWAFVEEGRPVPPPGSPERFERGVLGDYSLSIGNGYLIHGTLYQRLLGMPVTHGCVRLGDADLEKVYQTLQVGARVFIY